MFLCSMYFLVLCIKGILSYFSYKVIFIYVFTCAIVYELQIFFSRGIASGTIDYDFETGLLFSRNPSRQLPSFSPWVIIYDQKVFWNTLKDNYVSRWIFWWIRVEKLRVLKTLYNRIKYKFFIRRLWYDVILTLMSRTLSILYIVPRTFMVLFYSVYILHKVWGLYKSDCPKEVNRLYIHELFQTFYFFRVLVPKNFYAYIIGKGLTFYTTDVTQLAGSFKDFGFYVPIRLNVVFNVFVAPYYIAFRKVQSIVWLLSPLQSFYVVKLGETWERFMKPDDLRDIQVPILRLKDNSQPLYIRVMSVLLFLLIDHVRTLVSLPAIMYGRTLLQANIWNSTTQNFERLTLDHTLREGWEGVMEDIFSMITLRGCITLYVPDTLDTLMIGVSTQNLDIDSPNWPTGTRFTISTEGDSRLFVKRPTRNWSYSGIYFHTTLAEFAFKVDWRYLFKDTRNLWCNKKPSLFNKVKDRIKKEYLNY